MVVDASMASGISQRAQSIDSSGIRRIFELGASLKDPVNLSIGIPDFDAFPEIKSSAKAAIDGGKNSYTVTQGIPELRSAVRLRHNLTATRSGSAGTDELDVLITSGVSGGLFLSYAVLLDPGDEILIPDPYFGMYRDLARMLSATPVCYDCYPKFALPIETIERLVTPRTKAILVNSPANPTGYAVTESELIAIIDICRSNDLWLIYDEIYELFCYDQPHVRCIGKYEKAIVLNGFSKSHGVPGWRLGYAIAPGKVIQQMAKLQQYSFVCAPSITQWGITSGVLLDLSSVTDEYRRKRDFIYQALLPKYEVEKPGGAFYVFAPAPGGKSSTFIERCIAHNLLVVGGDVFSSKDSHFRLSFSAPMEKLERGAEILLKLA